MELIHNAMSPFGRKVRAVAHEIGIAERVRLTEVRSRQDPDKIQPFNPLGKIPVFISDAGAVLYDSSVICEFLIAEFGDHRLLPRHGMRRWEILTLAALADGILEAGISVRYERARPADEQSASAVSWQLGKIEAGLGRLDATVDQFGDTLDLGQIGVACALGYLPLRIDECAGLLRWPRLAQWYERIGRRPSLRDTAPAAGA
ncbi:MAG: glutathione S-transferase family protein [Lautropia sp.]